MLIHTVYFWLKAGSGAGVREQLVGDCRELLGGIESVRGLWAGVPAGTGAASGKVGREVVEEGYGVGLTVMFEDVAGHDAYQVHTKHLEFIERNKGGWERVVVFDVVEG